MNTTVVALALVAALDVSQVPAPVFRAPRVAPAPAEMTFEAKTPVRLNDVAYQILCPDAQASDWVSRHAKQWFGAAAKVKQVSTVAPKGLDDDEAYRLTVDPKFVRIEAPTIKGVRWAMMTLRQAARRESGGATLHGYWLPALKVTDAPKTKFRAFHFSGPTGPGGSLLELERKVRLAAYYKCNYVVVELWSFFESVRHPELNAPNVPINASTARRLVEIGRDLGVTLVPGLQIAGHAADGVRGRHNYLDLHPDALPLFENNKAFNWCLTNPDARRICRELVEEIHEAFLNPPFFHINCDEIEPPDCPTCRAVGAQYPDYFCAHVTALADMLRKRGARAMVWHDMLLDKKNAAWKPFYANGDANWEKMAANLPKDIIVCDWYYGGNYGHGGKTDPGGYPTMDHFKALGFDVITCPFQDEAAMRLQADYVRKAGLFGFMETTWYSRERKLQENLIAAADAAWGANRQAANYHDATYYWRQVGWDAGMKDFKDAGFTVKKPEGVN